jgi:hypothetical protein
MVGMEDYTVPVGTHLLVADDSAGGMTNMVMVDWNGNMDMVNDGQGWQLTSGMGMPLVYDRETPGEMVNATEFMLLGLGLGAVIAVSAMMLTTVKRVLGSSATYD